jgi:effector-binding domain-containing protein
MDYQCELLERPSQPTLSVRFRAPVQELSQHFGRIYGGIMQYLGELGEHPTGAPFAAYYNMDMQDLDVEAGFPVSKSLPARDDIQPGQLPGGKAATCLYVGPYDQVGPAWEALSQWITEHGHEAAGPAYEMYLNDPNQQPPQEPITQLVLPLKG